MKDPFTSSRSTITDVEIVASSSSLPAVICVEGKRGTLCLPTPPSPSSPSPSLTAIPFTSSQKEGGPASKSWPDASSVRGREGGRAGKPARRKEGRVSGVRGVASGQGSDIPWRSTRTALSRTGCDSSISSSCSPPPCIRPPAAGLMSNP